jgi:hypothetical protein
LEPVQLPHAIQRREVASTASLFTPDTRSAMQAAGAHAWFAVSVPALLGTGTFVLALLAAVVVCEVLYWIIRLAVRHGVQDADRRQ